MNTRPDPGLIAAVLAWLGLALAILLVSALVAHGRTRYAGEWDNVDPKVRSWFRSIRSPHGVPCCDMADGHRTLEDRRGNTYWIPDPAATDGLAWIEVPPEAVVHNAGNPTGEAVVWYVIQSPGHVFIRCFVPGGDA